MSTAATLELSPVTIAPPAHPCLVAILRRLSVTLLVAVIVPAALFYAALNHYGLSTAVLSALVWTYGAITVRWATGRPMSGLLLLTVTLLTIRTVFTLVTGNAFIYFFQPVITDALAAGLFLVSLATARPVVARMAADFYPMDPEIAGRPSVSRLFWRLTLLWGSLYIVKCAVGFWLLETVSIANLVLIKTLFVTSLTLVAVAVTVYAATAVLRQERMLPGAVPA